MVADPLIRHVMANVLDSEMHCVDQAISLRGDATSCRCWLQKQRDSSPMVPSPQRAPATVGARGSMRRAMRPVRAGITFIVSGVLAFGRGPGQRLPPHLAHARSGRGHRVLLSTEERRFEGSGAPPLREEIARLDGPAAIVLEDRSPPR
jgi:hypothetical protein